MLLPPFTLLIVKKAHRPVTLRITGWFVLMTAMLVVLIIAGTAAIMGRFVEPMAIQSAVDTSSNNTTVEYMLVPAAPDSKDVDEKTKPDIAEFAVTRNDNGDVVFTFSVEHTPAGEELYLWIIVNPEAASGADVMIYPRGPLFRGFPVDYRNGIRHTPGNGRQIRLTFTDQEATTDFEQFRILAYEPSGELLIDKTLAVRNDSRI